MEPTTPSSDPAPASPAPRRARVAISSHFYPVGVSRYLERAFRRLRTADGQPLEVLSVGPTSGAGIPWGAEFRFPQYAFTPTHRLPLDPREAKVRLERMLHGRKGQPAQLEGVDLWVDVADDYFVHVEIPAAYRAVVLTDPHVRGYQDVRAFANASEKGAAVFVMQSSHARHDERVLSYAFDEETHFEEPRGMSGYDVSILGAPYPNRVRLARALKARGLRVLDRWGDLFEECRISTLAAPVTVVWAISDDLPARVFESAAMGRAVIASRSDDLETTFGDLVPSFRGFEECVEKTVELCANAFRARELGVTLRDAVWEDAGEGRPEGGWTARAAALCRAAGIDLAPGWSPMQGRYRPCTAPEGALQA